jgi:3-dehydroquinate dehydratase-2
MITENKLIYVLNGPNLNLLGLREPEIYGYETFDEIKSMMKEHADKLGFAIDVRQTNHEGVLVDWLQEAYEKSARAVILNAAAYTHTSVIEVHLSDPMKREGFRHLSYVGMAAVKCIKGQGANGYLMALDAVAKDKI